jgi:hypothetical protein
MSENKMSAIRMPLLHAIGGLGYSDIEERYDLLGGINRLGCQE